MATQNDVEIVVDQNIFNSETKKKKRCGYKLNNDPDADALIIQLVNRKYKQGEKINWKLIAEEFIAEKQSCCTFQPSEISPKKLHDRFENYLRPELDFSPMTWEEIMYLISLVDSGIFTEKSQIKWKKIKERFRNRSPSYLKNTYYREKNRREKPRSKIRNRIGGPKKSFLVRQETIFEI